MPTLELECRPSDEKITKGLEAMRRNSYPGRIAIMGLSLGGDLALQAYVLMGRKPASRNRILVNEGKVIRVVAPDKTPEEMAATRDAALIYYPAMEADFGAQVVSNGAQTRPLLGKLLDGHNLETAVLNLPRVGDIDLSIYEPDPSNTPRINGVIDLDQDAPTAFGLSVVRKHPESDDALYSFYVADSVEALGPGVGYGVQTYNGDRDPLPSFDQEAFAFPMEGDAQATARRIWDALNIQNRVAVVVRATDIGSGEIVQTHILNALTAA